MAGRIRTLKPEWLENERLAACSDNARVLSVGLILVADDYGNGRAGEGYLIGQLWHATTDLDAARDRMRESLRQLAQIGYLALYQVNGQTYFTLLDWERHQLVKHPSKPRVPSQNDGVTILSQETLRKSSGESPETLTPDHDLDLDLDPTSERESPARVRVADFEPRLADGTIPGALPSRSTLQVADAIWCEQERRKDELRAGGIDPGSRGLGLVSPLKAKLHDRIRERAEGEGVDAAEAICRHVLDVVLADCQRERTLRWANGGHWDAERFSDALSREVGSPFRRPARRAGAEDAPTYAADPYPDLMPRPDYAAIAAKRAGR